MKFNENQQLAITSNANKILLVASAGSGKTTILIEKVKHLVDSGVNPESILMLTFSNQASNQLKERLINRIGLQSRDATIGTFHSFALRLIRTFIDETTLSPYFKIIDQEEQNRYLSTVANELKYNRYQLREYKENLQDYTFGKPVPDRFLLLHNKLKEKIKNMNMIALDDLIPLATSLLEKEVVIDYAKSKYQYIFVDEFQDINEHQSLFLKPLIAHAKQFVVVGDDDQCIYEWRGSKPDLMLNMSKESDVEKIFLVDNYRSQQNIINFANQIINNNQIRVKKAMKPTINPLYIPAYNRFKTSSEEASYLANEIKRLYVETNLKLDDIAILVRKDSQTPAIISELKRYHIPYVNYNENIMQNKWVINYLKELAKANPKLALLVNYPQTIIDNPKYQLLCEEYSLTSNVADENLKRLYELNVEFENSDLFKERINLALKLIQMKEESNLLNLIDYLLDEVTDIEEYVSSENRKYYELVSSIATEYQNLNKDNNLANFIEYFEVILEDLISSNENGVKIMTIHKAKGLEFNCVFIPGVELGNFPDDYHVYTTDDLEAERRLLYVAITRAKERLYITNKHTTKTTPLLKDGFNTEITNALAIKNLYYEKSKKATEEVVLEEVLTIHSHKIFDEDSKAVLERNGLINIFEEVISKWIDPSCPMLSREIQSLIEDTEVVITDLIRKLEPANIKISSSRIFIAAHLKIIFDTILKNRSDRVADYLSFGGVHSQLELIKFHDKLISSKRINRSYSQTDITYLIDYKRYLDVLHHRFEPKHRERNRKIISDFNNKDINEKIKIILSILKFLKDVKTDEQFLKTIENKLK